MYWRIKVEDTQGSTHHLNQLVMLHMHKKFLILEFDVHPQPQSLEYLEFGLHLLLPAFVTFISNILFLSLFSKKNVLFFLVDEALRCFFIGHFSGHYYLASVIMRLQRNLTTRIKFSFHFSSTELTHAGMRHYAGSLFISC